MSDVVNCLWIGWSADKHADKPVSGCVWWWAVWQGGCFKVFWEHMAGVEVEQQHCIEWWVRSLAKQLQHNVLQACSKCESAAPSQHRVRSGCGKILSQHWHCIVWGGGSLATWLQQSILGVTWHTLRWSNLHYKGATAQGVDICRVMNGWIECHAMGKIRTPKYISVWFASVPSCNAPALLFRVKKPVLLYSYTRHAFFF
jgi:hypothetical protein